MAIIIPFNNSRVEKNADPEELRLFRQLVGSEDIRILLGDFFLELCANEPPSSQHPHADLLERMLAGRSFACNDQLRILVDNLDRLRNHDLGHN